VDQSINKTTTLGYNSAPNIPTRYVFRYSEAAFVDGTTSRSSLKRARNASTYHYIKDLIALKTIRYNLINEKLNPVDEISKQWKHQKIWNHGKSLLVYSGDTNDLMRPADKWEEKVKIIGGYNKFNISPRTRRFQTIILAFQISSYICRCP
jgi:hypothetical protein